MKHIPCKVERIKKCILLILAVLIPYTSVYFSEIQGFIHKEAKAHVLTASAATISTSYIAKEEFIAEEMVKDRLPSLQRESLANRLKAFLGMKLQAVELLINGERLITLYDKEEVNKVINNLKVHYIEKGSIQKSTIEAIELKGEVEIKDAEAYDWQIDTMDIALHKLIEACNRGAFSLETTTLILEKQEISPSVSVISTEELYVGESITQEGKKGSKEIKKRITYLNDNKVTETILEENILEESTETVILKGSKITESNLSALLATPSRGVISSNYGMRWGRLHKGTDFAANIGDPISAALDGVVIEAAYIGNYGNVVILDHGSGIETLYAHCSEIKVKVGSRVKKGEVIALVGNTGRSTGPHLHFEVRINGEPRDARKYLQVGS